MPLDTAKISAMPMMPMEPAKEVSRVRLFLLIRFFSDSPKDVAQDMEGLRSFFAPC